MSNSINEAAIRQKAYELWQARGCPEGTSDEDWYAAIEALQQAKEEGVQQTVTPEETPPVEEAKEAVAPAEIPPAVQETPPPPVVRAGKAPAKPRKSTTRKT